MNDPPLHVFYLLIGTSSSDLSMNGSVITVCPWLWLYSPALLVIRLPIFLNMTSNYILSLGRDPQVTRIRIPITQEKFQLHKKVVVHHHGFFGLVNITKWINLFNSLQELYK